MKKAERIPINIWDDFYDDGYVPENEIQETYAYVEDYESFTEEENKTTLQVLFDYIKANFELGNVEMELIYHDTKNDYNSETVEKCIKEYGEKFFFKRYEIIFKNITHEFLENLVEELNKAKLTYKNIPFDIYSES